LKTKRVFVRYVSHEIRTPLNITLLGLKFLEDELQKNDKNMLGNVNDVLEDVKSSCGVAVEILNDLLLYEKLDDGIFTLSLSEVPFRDFFTDAVNVFKVQVRRMEDDLCVCYCLELLEVSLLFSS
jgi:signal transduction histidine kinase